MNCVTLYHQHDLFEHAFDKMKQKLHFPVFTRNPVYVLLCLSRHSICCSKLPAFQSQMPKRSHLHTLVYMHKDFWPPFHIVFYIKFSSLSSWYFVCLKLNLSYLLIDESGITRTKLWQSHLFLSTIPMQSIFCSHVILPTVQPHHTMSPQWTSCAKLCINMRNHTKKGF